MDFLKILDVILEGYDHVSMDRIKSFKNLTDYIDFENKKIINGYTYLNFLYDDDYYIWGKILVFDNEDGTEVANSSYGKQNEEDQLKASIDVRPDKRRKGIASNIYMWIEELTGEKLYPDLPHTKAAQNFWANPNRKFGYDK